MMKLYNTLTKEKEDFTPIDLNSVKIYQCGPTVYWTQHIGNMRAVVMTDLLARTLKYLGYKIKLVRNYTDVGHLTSDSDEGEDKISKTAQKEGKTPEEIAEKYIKIFENDVKELNTISPDFKPKATEHISQIIEMVEILLKKGFAYETPLAIYFDISKAKDYTRLSGQILKENKVDAGHGNINDSNKKNPADFAIWFFKTGLHKNALQTWKNPFSGTEGFPGWHIECSAMIKKILGDTIDIHLGGIEHIPVHHTNEIAQSESANDKIFVKYWIHYEHLLVNNKKMSKSEGTGYSLEEVKEKGFNPLSFRYFLLTSHYRSKQNFTWEALQDAENAYFKLVKKVAEILKTNQEINIKDISEEHNNKFIEAISNDLNIPEAVAILWNLLKDQNIAENKKINTIANFDEVLGLCLLEKANMENKELKNIPKEIIELSKDRNEAKKNKDWVRADELRNKIIELGYEIKDTENGTEISKK